MHPDSSCKRQEAGLTLLEVLIALLIAGFALGALFQGTLGGLRSAGIAARTEVALSHARSRLAAIGRSASLVAEDSQGEDGEFRWRTRITALTAGPDVALYRIQVTVGWGDGGEARSVALETRRLGAAPPPAP